MSKPKRMFKAKGIRAEDGSIVNPNFYQPRIKAEDGSFVNPNFYKKQNKPTKPKKPGKTYLV